MNEKTCFQKGFKKQTLDPVKRCMDRYKLMDNGKLMFERQSPRRQKLAYMTDEFCFEINKDAKSKYEHFPSLCVDTRKEESRLT